MAQCPTCHSKLSCGCQLRTASNGARVCSLCLTRYEKQLADQKKAKPSNPGSTTPSNLTISYNPPK